MVDQQRLFERFFGLLQNEPSLPEYLGEEPESVTPFDPYQMVAEWMALRHEMKQQGKLLQATQNTLQQALEGVQAEKNHLQQPLEANPKQGVQIDPKPLWRDLLSVLDALDQACTHWQEQIEALSQLPEQPASAPQPWWQRWIQPLTQPQLPDAASTTSSLREVLLSNQQGVNLIRRSLLDVLRQRQVTPIEAQGTPFNPQTMYAIGRQESASIPENTVVQEVVRGYWWGDQVLREAQVIVAVKQREQ
ncbi:nucleotide exchange factor GrpE [Oculatella sp. LEGE 06141]|uniref:nucleotide exchange factor GrpE n=1 Tax=Oculatella sp. LEGE 06141 TaxID=1828648 RepID=UPI001882B93F|nr:nucleotide exchange factor GrpE [Oculatella sp. LEGE 06141]MBE9181531.1 nucleotide exchange factor GrpE [Oculatella sp. LEGE 06141]